jgi:hypothetical protein
MDMSEFTGKERCNQTGSVIGQGRLLVFLIVLFLRKQYSFRFISATKGVVLVDVSAVAYADDSVERIVSKESKCAY